MEETLKQIILDREKNFFPEDDEFWEKVKCEIKVGSKIHWYFQEDKDFADKQGFDVKDEIWFSGIIVPFPEVTLERGSETSLEYEDCLVVVTRYPAEKEYCRTDWISLHRLLDQKNLIEIYS